MKNYFCLLALLFITLCSNSQSNYQDAIVISNNGDSVHGKIDYRNWKNNPKSVNFIDDKNKAFSFEPTSIKGFYIPSANETYTSFIIEAHMLPQQENEAIDYNNNLSSPFKGPAFLLQLIKHPLSSLYLLVFDDKKYFYYVRNDEGAVEIIHYYLYNDSTKQVTEINEYKKQLADLFSSCPDVALKVGTLRLNQKEVQDIFIKYIQCAAPGAAVGIKAKDKNTFKFGIIAGAMLNKYQVEGTNQFLVDENYSSNSSPVLGVSMDLGLSRNQNKWHIINEVIYKSYKTSSSFERPYGNGYSVASDVSLGFSYTQINTLLRYVYQSGKSLRPYINLGIGNGFIIKVNQNSKHNVYSFGREDNEEAINGPAKYEFSIQGGAGIEVKNIQVELRLGKSKKAFSPYKDFNVNATSIQVLFTYQFK